MNNFEYDERQIIIRGDIFTKSFFLLLVLIAITSSLASLNINLFDDRMIEFIFITVIAVTYAGVRLIINDAYIGFKTNENIVNALFVIGVMNIVIGFINMFHNSGIFTNGLLNYHASNFLIGAMLLINSIAYKLNSKKN